MSIILARRNILNLVHKVGNMRLHNTLTRKIEEFIPVEGSAARVYTCGPTVYDHAHIGNLRSYIFADTLHRALELSGFEVLRAMNYTDIDDKTVRRSHELYPNDDPMSALKRLTSQYISIFQDDMKMIGNRTDNITYLPATDYIEEMQQLIKQLIIKKFAYIADDGVYFSIEAYKKSGKKYGQLLKITARNTSKERIQNDEYDKESVHDFALWKKQKVGEPSWQFILGNVDLTGRPGWHIECSAMTRKALNQPFDIHTGGVDNIFPHHENEIAQSTAGEENPVMSRFFIHGEHLLIDGGRMGKSLKNFYTVEDIVKKGYAPLAFRMLVLQSHYRSQVNLTWGNLDAAQNRLKALQAFADLRFQSVKTDGLPKTDFSKYKDAIIAALGNDLATPKALAILGDIADKLQSGVPDTQLKELTNFLTFVDTAFGLQLFDSSDIADTYKRLIEEREHARQSKNWEKSDELRNKLLELGIGLRDSQYGPIWYRI